MANAFDSDSKDCRFESCRVDHRNSPKNRTIKRNLGLFPYLSVLHIFTQFYALLRANVYQNVYHFLGLIFGLIIRLLSVLKMKFFQIFAQFCPYFAWILPFSKLCTAINNQKSPYCSKQLNNRGYHYALFKFNTYAI